MNKKTFHLSTLLPSLGKIVRGLTLGIVAATVLLGVSAPLVYADDGAEVAAPEAVVAEAAAPEAEAAPAPLVSDTGDTAWVLVSSALVLLMMPGLAFFYGGLVRKKNFLSVLMQCFILMGVITVQWVVIGYSLAFGPDQGGMIGSTAWAFLKGVGLEPFADYSATIPHQAFMIFQCMFAIITPGLIIGAFAERMKFSAFVIFSVVWATIVYDPICHWVWAVGGFVRTMGALDFAGGTVVHIAAGMAALAAALVLGKRDGYPNRVAPPHSLPFAVLGAGLLWFGWFGFNAGSALSANGLAANAFVVTNVAAAMAALSWAGIDWIRTGKPTMLGTITGAVAGLVAITPAAGFVNVLGALFIGLTVSMVCYLFVAIIKVKFGYDDSLDAFGVHGIGGIWGAIMTGVFATKTVNSAGADGWLYGNPAQVMIQVKAVLITGIYAFVVSFILLKVLDMVMGLRATKESESIGLDISDHSEHAYAMSEE